MIKKTMQMGELTSPTRSEAFETMKAEGEGALSKGFAKFNALKAAAGRALGLEAASIEQQSEIAALKSTIDELRAETAELPKLRAQVSAGGATMLAELESNLDFTEPFGRIRDGVSEARKMGVGNRQAA